ncbi:MAG: DNA integrity scanning protein DisA nucleotide-binding domain protein [Deltaproteobacteria bacterium]|nr:DNA integrity scanning protein DisA nucleotide-binding domain protein [Deltaproteobacteria bacterium]
MTGEKRNFDDISIQLEKEWRIISAKMNIDSQGIRFFALSKPDQDNSFKLYFGGSTTLDFIPELEYLQTEEDVNQILGSRGMQAVEDFRRSPTKETAETIGNTFADNFNREFFAVPVSWHSSGVVELPNHFSCIFIYLPKSIDENCCLRGQAVPRKLGRGYVNVALLRSLVEYVLIQYYKNSKKCLESLSKRNSDLHEILSSAKEVSGKVFKEVGRGFLESAVARFTPADNNDELLFKHVCEIAMMNYEKKPIRGSLLLIGRDNKSIDVSVPLKIEIEISNYRAVRKLLEISKTNLKLLCDGRKIFGFGDICNSLDVQLADNFEVLFLGHGHWSLNHAERSLMDVVYQIASVPTHKIQNVELLMRLCRQTAQDSDGIAFDKITAIVECAIDKQSGAILIVSDNVNLEKNRLANDSFPLATPIGDPRLIADLAAIDGAVLLDFEGKAHAFGAILDGVAVPEANIARGSRFNSSIRYVANQIENNVKTLAIIISEDGMVNYYPKYDLPEDKTRKFKVF